MTMTIADQALAAIGSKYECAKPCVKCGGNTRYSSKPFDCVPCCKRRYKDSKPILESSIVKRESRRLRKETGMSAIERKEYAEFCEARGDTVISTSRPAVPITETVSYSVLNRRNKDSLIRMIIRDRARIKELELALGKL